MKLTRRGFLQVAGTAIATGACSASSEGTLDAGAENAPADAVADLVDAPLALDASADATRPDAAADTTTPRDAATDALRDAPDSAPPGCGTTSDAGAPDARPDLGFGDIPLNAADFPQGVMAGDALPRSAMLWTRYTGTNSVRVRVVQTTRDGTIIALAFEGAVTATSGQGYVHFDVGGLTPGAFYRYAFIERASGRDVGRSRVGRFRAALAADDACTALTFGGVSCNNQRIASMHGDAFPPLQRAAGDALDFFIHAGDHIYADFYNAGAGASTLADYRDLHRTYWRIDGLPDVHASTGMYTLWDDHEVYNNWFIEQVERQGRQAQLDAARTAFFEFRAFRRSAADPDRVWRGFKWGRVAEFFILDVRSERRPSRDQYVSPAQLAWLKSGLAASNAVFKFVVTSKPITGRVAGDPGPARDDFWEAFPAQRADLLDHVVNNGIAGVVFLSGDIHTGMLSRVEAAGPYRALREVCMGPAGSGDQDGTVECAGTGQNEITVHRYNYTRFHADPVARTLLVAFVGGDGATICSKTLRL